MRRAKPLDKRSAAGGTHVELLLDRPAAETLERLQAATGEGRTAIVSRLLLQEARS